jgi:poly(3-hydroxybutyrate) depolymerase
MITPLQNRRKQMQQDLFQLHHKIRHSVTEAGIRRIIIMFTLLCATVLLSTQKIYCQETSNSPVRNTISFGGVEREYFVHQPRNFDSTKLYWLLVVVHGGGGNGRSYFLADGIRKEIEKPGFDAIVVTPSFSNTDFLASRFPALGEGDFLNQIIEELRDTFILHKKILLTGYSRGGQFSHRFAFQNPDLVKACAPFAAGTWTTPGGTLLIESLDEITDPEIFLSSESNVALVPKRLRNMFEPRVARVAGVQAKNKAKEIPFLVMCGTLDPRHEIAKQFATSLKTEGYQVQTVWPDNPHGNKEQYPDEFRKYSQSAVQFFQCNTFGK